MPKINLSNSIYQQQNSGYGLNVKDGMLINNRPDGTTGIKQACELKKITKKMEKVNNIAEGVRLGEMMKF